MIDISERMDNRDETMSKRIEKHDKEWARMLIEAIRDAGTGDCPVDLMSSSLLGPVQWLARRVCILSGGDDERLDQLIDLVALAVRADARHRFANAKGLISEV